MNETSISQPGRRPRVLHLVTKGVMAGAERSLIEISDAHDDRTWDVRYATLFPAGEMNRQIDERGHCCYALNFHRNSDMIRTAMQLARLVREQEIDILHTHLVHAGLAGVLARKIVGRRLRLVHTRHHSDALYQFGARFGLFYKAKVDGFIARNQDGVCPVSQTAKEILLLREGVKSDRVTVVHPGLDVDRFRARVTDQSGARIRAELCMKPSDPLLGVVAHLVPKKGHHYLLEAMPSVLARFPKTRLLLVGRGEELVRLEAHTQRLGLSQSVVFAGYRADIPDILAALDLLVQPSLEEGLPLSLIEGMALAKPIVATAVSGIPEVVENGVTGLLAPPADPAALAQAILELLSNFERSAQMGHQGGARARECFSISRVARQYEAVWAKVLSPLSR